MSDSQWLMLKRSDRSGLADYRGKYPASLQLCLSVFLGLTQCPAHKTTCLVTRQRQQPINSD